jgi:hypothetical protein
MIKSISTSLTHGQFPGLVRNVDPPVLVLVHQKHPLNLHRHALAIFNEHLDVLVFGGRSHIVGSKQELKVLLSPGGKWNSKFKTNSNLKRKIYWSQFQ